MNAAETNPCFRLNNESIDWQLSVGCVLLRQLLIIIEYIFGGYYKILNKARMHSRGLHPCFNHCFKLNIQVKVFSLHGHFLSCNTGSWQRRSHYHAQRRWLFRSYLTKSIVAVHGVIVDQGEMKTLPNSSWTSGKYDPHAGLFYGVNLIPQNPI